MADSIQDRLKRVPPFDDDVPSIRNAKQAMEQQSQHVEVTQEEEQEPKPVEVSEAEQVDTETKDETPEEPQVTEEEALENSKNPERTKEYIEKIKKEKVELENVLDSLKPKAPQPAPSVPNIPDIEPEVQEKVEKVAKDLTQDQVDDVYANLIDEDGYIDPKLLISTLKNANEEAKRAREEAELAKKEAQSAKVESERKIRDFEESREVRRVHKKYPQIDPKNENFNQFFWDDVRKELATAPFLKGETPTFMEAAEKIWNDRYAAREEVEPVKKEEKKKLEEAENAKRNINATSAPTFRKAQDYTPADTEALNNAVKLGKRGALAEKLKRSGY